MMKNIYRIGIVVLVLAITMILTNRGMTAIDQAKKNETYKELDLFADALAFVQEHYVDETNSKDLIYGALDGMLANLDPHSQFLRPEEYEELKADTQGEFGGVGIEITLKDNLITIITAVEGTPAWDAGLAPNDRIVKIADTVMRNLSLSEAVKLLRGKPGTEVTIIVWREREGKLLTFKVTRATIEIKDIKESRILEDGIGYLKLVEFREDTPRELDRSLQELKAQGMTALILDLRNNPGGLLDKAVESTERFIPTGELVVSLKGRDPSQNTSFISRYKKPWKDLPMILLVNAGSASGSEILAGCLKDYHRAILVGEKTFGKGSVQIVLPMRDGSALKMTTSRYYTPSGVSIHEKGIVPDVVVMPHEQPAPSEQGKQAVQLDSIFNGVEEQKPEDQARAALNEIYKKDEPLATAVDLLKGIQIYQKMLTVKDSQKDSGKKTDE